MKLKVLKYKKGQFALNGLLVILLINIPLFTAAQTEPPSKKRYPFLSASYHQGQVMATNEFVKGDNLSGQPINKFQAATLKIGLQNPGYRDWQKVYQSPYYGIGFYIGEFHTKELGNPIAAYGFLGLPIKRWKKLETYAEFQFGLTWNWNHYDSIYNPKNIAIGGSLTVFLDIGLKAHYPISKHLDLGAGISFTHFSNGGFERPNRGLNMWSPSIELKYNIKGRPDVRNTPNPGRLPRNNELIFMLGYGDHQIVEHEMDSNYFAVGGFGMYYLWQHGNAFKSGPGIDLNFWWGLTANDDGTPGPIGWDNLTVGLIYQPELIIGQMSLVGGVGIYALHHQYGNFQQLYQRLGVKYHFTQYLSFGINIRSINFMLAEVLEFNLGYRIKWAK